MAEVAGLVLGAFPFIVHAIDLYIEGIQLIKKYRNYCRILKSHVRKLKMEQLKLSTTCELLLCDVVDEESVARLFEASEGWRWKEEGLRTSFKARLGKSFGIFFETLESMTDATEELKKALDLDADNNPKWVNYKVFKKEWKRVQQTLCGAQVEELFKSLSDSNRDLEQLVRHSQKIEALKVPKLAANAKNYESVRGRAKDLYFALKKSFSQPCECVLPHHVCLLLEHRNSAVAAINNSLDFEAVFHFEKEHSRSVPWDWREMRIRALESSDDLVDAHGNARASYDNSNAASVPSTSSSDNASTPPSLASARLPSKTDPKSVIVEHKDARIVRSVKSSLSRNGRDKNLRFALAHRTSTETSRPDGPIPLTNFKSSPAEKIGNLCKALLGAENSEFLGVIAGDRNIHHRVTCTNALLGLDTRKTSLGALLKRHEIGKRERLELGVRLASTLLQLHDTPWLPDQWSKDDIYYLTRVDTDKSDLPYLSKHFVSPSCTNLLMQPTQNMEPSLGIKNQSIFALGVVLIELWFGKPFDQFRDPRDLGYNNAVNSLSDYATASRLIEDVYEEAGQWYGDAVRRCVYCEFDQRENSLNKGLMKEAVHRGVVAPLEKNLDAFCGWNIEDVPE